MQSVAKKERHKIGNKQHKATCRLLHLTYKLEGGDISAES